jgi:propionyl-CoA carboxylase alpha chain
MPVTLYYDPMLAKVIVWGADRAEAIERMLEALDRLHVAGISTTVPFCRFVLSHPAFISGDYSTGFVSEHWSGVQPALDAELTRLAAAAAIRATQRISERVQDSSGQRTFERQSP